MSIDIRRIWGRLRKLAMHTRMRFGYVSHRFLRWSPRCIRVIPARHLKIWFEYFVDVETAERWVRGEAAVFRDPGTIVRQYTKKYIKPVILERDGFRCVYCGRSDELLTLDHVIPRSKGGLTVPNNLVTACVPCNQEKGTQDLDEFLYSLPEVLKELTTNAQLDIQPITILNLYVDIDGNHEERIPAFLTSANHAMFVDRNTGNVMFGGVIPTADPSIYTGDENTFFTELGKVEDSAQDAEIIGQLTAALNSMSAYDFIAKVIIHVEQDVDYAGLIVPNLILEAK